jgi:hypothetical protein
MKTQMKTQMKNAIKKPNQKMQTQMKTQPKNANAIANANENATKKCSPFLQLLEYQHLLNTINLLIKMACFVKKEKYISVLKAAELNQLNVQGGHPY